jgi:hypothetical protein
MPKDHLHIDLLADPVGLAAPELVAEAPAFTDDA